MLPYSLNLVQPTTQRSTRLSALDVWNCVCADVQPGLHNTRYFKGVTRYQNDCTFDPVLLFGAMCTRNAPTVIRNTEDSRYTYHSRLLEDSYHSQYPKDYVDILHDLIQTLKDAKVPGPTLFRLRSEFTDVIEAGGESEIRGIGLATLRRLREGDPKGVLKWPVEGIAIKQHKPRQIGSSRLGSRFLAAKREVLALAPLFDKHPNIVRLLGWGICLDTIEHPLPGSLQIPLLVLERAETDLYRFLTQNTPGTTQTLGYWKIYRMGRASHLVDTELGDTHIIHRPYDLLRRLCIDVGNGLQALHEYNFAHGDLKPQNVLVFKNQGGWVAKLCDFGCTRGVVDSNSVMSESMEQSGSTKIGYAGTKGWLPPETGPLGYDKIEYKMLQKCDIYAYGLLIWSVFCKAGNSPILEWNGPELLQLQPDSILERALDDVDNMVSHESKSLAITLKDILKDTLQLDPNERFMMPWVRLHTRFENSSIRVRDLWKLSRLLAKSTLQILQKEKDVSVSSTVLVQKFGPHLARRGQHQH
jgi:serine/threonine protein kinase